MVLADIVFSPGDVQQIIIETSVDSLNAPLDIVTESDTSTGIAVEEIPDGGGETSHSFFS